MTNLTLPSSFMCYEAGWNAINRGTVTGLFTHTMTKNPRLTCAVAGTTAVVSVLSDYFKA
jgi:hypothetical protein